MELCGCCTAVSEFTDGDDELDSSIHCKLGYQKSALPPLVLLQRPLVMPFISTSGLLLHSLHQKTNKHVKFVVTEVS